MHIEGAAVKCSSRPYSLLKIGVGVDRKAGPCWGWCMGGAWGGDVVVILWEGYNAARNWLFLDCASSLLNQDLLSLIYPSLFSNLKLKY